MSLLAGIKLMQSPLVRPVPKVQCSIDYPGTPEGKAAMNAWLLERFGTKEVCYVFKPELLGLIGDPVAVLRPEHMAMISHLTA